MDVFTIGVGIAVLIFLFWLVNSVYVIKEWERGVVLRLGRMLPEAKGAGLQLVFFPIDKLTRISLRIETLDVPPQDVITRDNVSVKVNAVCYFRVVDANLALSQVQNYLYATSQLAQTTLRSLIGQFELDSILSEREKVNAKLQQILDQDTEPWPKSLPPKANFKPPRNYPKPRPCCKRSQPPSSCAICKRWWKLASRKTPRWSSRCLWTSFRNG
jgi:regulator of protease activity HflC (stomatin/prohibitin superfamily)